MQQMLIAAIGLMLSVGWGNAQTPAAPMDGPRFEVASVRVNRSGELGARFQYGQGGRLTATNVPLRRLIAFAFQVQNFQIEGGPDWIRSERFDILASAATDTPADQVRLMARALLAERFGFVYRSERREQPIYALTINRADGRLGPGLRPTTLDCSTVQAPQPGGCGYFGPAADQPITAGRLSFRAFSLDTFAQALTGLVGRMVVNRTGLAGTFDGDFDATAELPPPPPPPGTPDPFNRQEMPSVFTVLAEQLGLKLESTRGTVDTLTIVDVRRPTEQ